MSASAKLMRSEDMPSRRFTENIMFVTSAAKVADEQAGATAALKRPNPADQNRAGRGLWPCATEKRFSLPLDTKRYVSEGTR